MFLRSGFLFLSWASMISVEVEEKRRKSFESMVFRFVFLSKNLELSFLSWVVFYEINFFEKTFLSSGKQQNFSPHARANHSNAFAQQKIRNNNIDCTPVNLDDPLSHSLSLSLSLSLFGLRLLLLPQKVATKIAARLPLQSDDGRSMQFRITVGTFAIICIHCRHSLALSHSLSVSHLFSGCSCCVLTS